ncbi:MAG: hypothetical protein V4812_15800 [Pseudomonadota bacterium]
MKKSHLVFNSVLTGGVLLGALHHGTVYRDQYNSREACEADWRQYPGQCQEQSGSGSHYYGPSYVEGKRPRTLQPHNVTSREMIKRSGFGRSGARFSGGG